MKDLEERELLERAKELAGLKEKLLSRDFRVDLQETQVEYKVFAEGSWKTLGKIPLSPGLEALESAVVVLWHRLLKPSERKEYFKGDFKEKLFRDLEVWFKNKGRRPKHP